MIENKTYVTYWNRIGAAPVRLETPVTMSEWDHSFPRFRVRYSGWNANISVDLDTQLVAEPLVAVRMADMLQAEHPTWWVRVEDLGTAKFPTRRDGTTFYALDGRKGFITIRQRFTAYVEWDGEPRVSGGTYPLENMRDAPPAESTPTRPTWLYPSTT
uniref:hypothetical protein n=1 Tax=Streptomyces sp. CA-136453 TaxID=3240050 RepID=UPI003F499E71